MVVENGFGVRALRVPECIWSMSLLMSCVTCRKSLISSQASLEFVARSRDVAFICAAEESDP